MNILFKSYSTLKSKKRKGFTLIELVVVIATMAILALLLVPNLSAYISKANTAKVRANMKNIHTAAELVNQTEGDLILDDIISFSNAKSGTVEIGSEFVDKTYTVSKNSDTGQITIRYRSDKSGDHIFPDNGGSLVSGPIDESGNDEPGIDESRIDSLIADGYIPIATAEDLNSVRSTNKRIYAAGTEWETENTVAGGLNKKYIQVADIDLSKFTNFEPIGTSFWAFSGIYDGGGYAISNLTIDGGSESGVGLFGGARGATFKNVGLEDVDVTGNSNHTGGLVGVQYNSSVMNSYATGSVTGRDYTGGLVGDQRDSSITNSYATGSVTGGSQVGGLVGRQYGSSTVTNSYATGSVTGKYRTGGLVGSQSDSSVRNSYATGTVTGTVDWTGGLVGQQSGSSVSNSYATVSVTSRNYTGGLVGDQSRSSVTNSYATGSVTGSRVTGGLVGSQNRSSISNSYATGSVNSSWMEVGGLVGYQEGSSTVRNSYATGSVTGASYAGGLVGRQEGSSITNSYATGSVTCTGKYVGGLVGDQYDSTISDSYATGTVTGRHPIGGLVGRQDNPSTVTNSYYDTETTGQSDTGKGTGKPTEEMKNKDTYTDWDNTLWEFKDSQYPTLR